MRTLDLAPEFAERVPRPPGARTVSSGWQVPNYFPEALRSGLALVGDAGYTKDFISRPGRSRTPSGTPELCSAALDEALSGRQPYDTR